MSFSSEVKKELCTKKKKIKNCCKKSVLYGALLFANTFTYEKIKIVSENKNFIDYVINILSEDVSIIVNCLSKVDGQLYTILITDKQSIDTIFTYLNLSKRAQIWGNGIDEQLIIGDCCKGSFLRGVFLACGTISDIEKNYHLDMSTTHIKLCDDLYTLIVSMELQPKITKRKNRYVIYFKESGLIEDFLNTIGATKSALALMEVKAMRDFRNNINRRVNCETANLIKTANASLNQVNAIEKIIKLRGLEFLDEDLQDVAKIRIENPDMSLKGIGESLSPQITRHGVNHRLKKIMEIANEL